MKGIFLLLIVLIPFSFLLLIFEQGGMIQEAESVETDTAYSRLPLYFIQNNGQTERDVRFYEKGSGHTTFFTREGVYLNLFSGQRSAVSGNTKHQTLDTELIKLSFINANREPEIIGEGLQGGRVNYFLGNNPTEWKTNIPAYNAVVYKKIYPDIDMKFYGNNKQLEYDIIVKPGADPKEVKLSYEEVKDLRITEEGDLEIELKEGNIIQKRPYIYQEIDGKKVEVEGRFKIQGPKNQKIGVMGSRGQGVEINDTRTLESSNPVFIYGFDIASYDKRYPLIIDPVLIYSTYLGGRDIEQGFGIAVDSSGNAYVTGVTMSFKFPTVNSIQRDLAGNFDVFIAKINKNGSALIYSTYLGGMMADYGYAIAVAPSGNVYLTGSTNSFNFPQLRPLQSALGGDYDAFVAKLDPRGRLIYSTYLGGNRLDEGRAITIGASDNVYITGRTDSANFPTEKPFQRSFSGDSGSEAFITEINPTGTALVYSTYLGGTAADQGFGIAVDANDNAYVTGDTRSANFPTSDKALQPSYGGSTDAFVVKLNPKGSLIYSTFLGGRGNDNAFSIGVDSSGNVYVTGATASSNFPLVNPLQPELKGDYDIFVAKIEPFGSALVYSTYLGGSGFERGNGIAVDSAGNAYIIGQTNSSDFPTLKPFQRFLGGGMDAFVAKINPIGSALVYSTYLGGKKEDQGKGIALDSLGNAYLVGRADSRNFPTARALQRTSGGFGDAFIAKIANTPRP